MGVKTQRKRKMNICHLPNEILHQVVSYITRPKDLLSLCLVSKHVSEISFPKLYHDIDLVDPPSYTDFRDEVVKLNHILTTISNSRGVKSVRILRIPWFNDKFCHPTFECPVFVPLHLTFFTLLSRMEDNSLLRLEHPRLNREILEYLCLHQKNTCNLTLIWFRYCFTLLSDMLPDLLGMSVSVTELDLEIFENLQLPSINWSRLLKLRVVIRRRTPANIDWINTFLSCGLTRLTHLIIHGLHHSSTPLAIRACPSLTHVSILFDIIFRDFVMKISNPTIKHIHVSSYHARPGLVICIIRQLKDLESLRVSAGMMNPRRSEALATSILAHKATLQILTLHNRNFTTSSNYAQFVHLARQCQNLSQLRLALGEETILENCKSLIESLPLLVTLKVNVVGPEERVQEAECTDLATRTAHDVMKKLPASSKFALLAFCFFNRPKQADSPDNYKIFISEQREKYRCQYFVRRHRAPPDVQAQARKGNKNAIRIDRKLARSIVLESGVIEHFCSHSDS